MDRSLYADRERESLVYFHQVSFVWERVDLVLPRVPTKGEIRKFKPSELIKKKLGTIINETDFGGLEEWPKAIETAMSAYSKSGPYVEGSRAPRRKRLERAREEMIDWIAGAREATKQKPQVKL